VLDFCHCFEHEQVKAQTVWQPTGVLGRSSDKPNLG
jgi:hypothetical protein